MLLHSVIQLFGEGLWKIGTVVFVLTGSGVAVCYAALKRLVPETAARLGALLLPACPALLDHTCTSMDAVFASVRII